MSNLNYRKNDYKNIIMNYKIKGSAMTKKMSDINKKNNNLLLIDKLIIKKEKNTNFKEVKKYNKDETKEDEKYIGKFLLEKKIIKIRKKKNIKFFYKIINK